MPSCELQLKNFNVNHLNYSINSKYSGDEPITIRPKFSIGAFQAEEPANFYKIVMGCSIFEDIHAPFKISVEVEGEFTVEGEKSESVIQYNAVAILIPYVRSLVTQLTCLAEKPPLFLPIINVYSLINGKKDNGTDSKNIENIDNEKNK